MIFYNLTTQIICGIFHILYGYTTLFFFIFYYIDVREKGLIYIISSIIVVIIFLNIHENFIRHLFFNIPFYQITNNNYLLIYLYYIMYLINNKIIKQNQALLSGIIKLKLHIRKCPKLNCPIIILIDDNFIIQGMSKKLLNIIQFKNSDFFLDNDIPFYMICKNFLNFYKTFIKRENKVTKKR